MRPDTEFLLGVVSAKTDILRDLIDKYCSDEQWVSARAYDELVLCANMVRGMLHRIIYNENVVDRTIRCDFCGAEIKEPEIFDRGDPTGVTFVHPDGSLTTACAKCMIRLGMVKDDEEDNDECQDSTV